MDAAEGVEDQNDADEPLVEVDVVLEPAQFACRSHPSAWLKNGRCSKCSHAAYEFCAECGFYLSLTEMSLHKLHGVHAVGFCCKAKCSKGFISGKKRMLSRRCCDMPMEALCPSCSKWTAAKNLQHHMAKCVEKPALAAPGPLSVSAGDGLAPAHSPSTLPRRKSSVKKGEKTPEKKETVKKVAKTTKKRSTTRSVMAKSPKTKARKVGNSTVENLAGLREILRKNGWKEENVRSVLAICAEEDLDEMALRVIDDELFAALEAKLEKIGHRVCLRIARDLCKK